MATQLQAYTTGDNTEYLVRQDDERLGQTFQHSSNFDITSIKLKLWKSGTPGTNLVVSIYATAGGKHLPTGAPIVSVNYPTANITSTSAPGAWYTVSITATGLSANTYYAIVSGPDEADWGWNNCIRWRQDHVAPLYNYGFTIDENNGVWDSYTYDYMFEVWGDEIAVPIISQTRLGSGGNFLLATTDIGVYLSTDFGDNWTKKLPDGQAATEWVKGICSSDGTYIIVVSSANAIYRSANSGVAWGAITPAGGDTFSVNDLAISDDGQYVVIVGENSTDATESCYISTDYGVTWTAKKPVDVSIEWAECDISNDGTIIAVSTTSYFYISLDSGATWLEQGMASTAEVWEGLSISGDGTTGLIANTNDDDEFFIGTNTELYSEATWAETALTSAGRSLLDDTTQGAQQTTLGLGTGDSPEFTGLTLSGLTATYVPFIDTGGVVAEDSLFTWNKTTNYLDIGYLRLGGERIIKANGPGADNGITINAQGTNGVYFNLTDGGTGGVYFYNGTTQKLAWFGGSTRGECRVFDEDYAEWLTFSCSSGYGNLEVTGTGTPQALLINNNAHSDIWMFQGSSSGETKGLRVYGYKSGDAKRFLDITTGGTAANTVDFTGVSNYKFGGAIAATNYAAANLLTACATNAGALDFSAASKSLTVENTAVVSQDYSSDASPQFTGIELGHATDTTITRASAGNLNIEGNLVYRAGGTDVPITDGGTGASTAQAAIDALTAVSGATNEHVLTKDTASGNAVWKVAAGGGGGFSSRCRVGISGNQTIPTGNYTVVQFNDEASPNYDNDGEWNSSTYKFTATSAGQYLIILNLCITSLGDGKLVVGEVRKNDVRCVAAYSIPGAAATINITACDIVELAVDDTIDARVYHNHGSDRTLTAYANDANQFIAIHRLS